MHTLKQLSSLVFFMKDGTTHAFPEGTIVNVEIDNPIGIKPSDAVVEKFFDTKSSIEISVILKSAISRKRFIKLLMAKPGIDRNTATGMANRSLKLFGRYDMSYLLFL